MRNCILMVLAVFCSVAGQALGVAVTPGGLASAVGAETDAGELVIEGAMDSRDFIFIEKNMPRLKKLDLSNAVFDIIPDATFAGSCLESMSLPAGCNIGCMAFSGSALTSVVLPAGCRVGDGAFAACNQLKKIYVSGNVSLGRNVFSDNTSLTAVEGSEYITAIYDRAFDGCSTLEKFDFSPFLSVLGYRAFANSGLKEANLGVCTMLGNVGGWVFADCRQLQSATLPSNHGTGIFFGCSALENIEISAGKIGDLALANTVKIEKMVLPEFLSYAGNSAMEGMKTLQEIDGRGLKTVPALGSDVWARSNAGTVTLKVATGMADAFASAPQWSDFIISAEQTYLQLPVVKENDIKVWFDGSDIKVESAGCNLQFVAVADIEGRSRLRASLCARQAVLDVSSLSAAVYIVEITLADGSRHVAKLKKNG